MSDYEVGYGKPPKSGQVRKGEVRNPYGRAGKDRALPRVTSEAALLEQIDGETVVVDGRAMTRREAHIRSQYMSALKGKANAIRFIDRLGRHRESEAQGGGVLALPCDSPDGWNIEDAIAQHNARLERERRNDLRRNRRLKAKTNSSQPLQLLPEWKILTDLETETVQYDGGIKLMRGLRLRLYKAFAAKGNRAAQEVLSRIQNAPRVTEQRRPGLLVIPAPVSI